MLGFATALSHFYFFFHSALLALQRRRTAWSSSLGFLPRAVKLHGSLSSCVEVCRFMRTIRGHSSPKIRDVVSSSSYFSVLLACDTWHATRRWRSTREHEVVEVVVPSARMTDLVYWGTHSAVVLSTVSGENLRLLRRDSCVTLDSMVTTAPTKSILQNGYQHNSSNRV